MANTLANITSQAANLGDPTQNNFVGGLAALSAAAAATQRRDEIQSVQGLPQVSQSQALHSQHSNAGNSLNNSMNNGQNQLQDAERRDSLVNSMNGQGQDNTLNNIINGHQAPKFQPQSQSREDGLATESTLFPDAPLNAPASANYKR